MNLTVIFGGVSSEYEISLLSATNILKNLDTTKYDISTIGITKNGEWYLYEGKFDDIANNSWLNGKITKAYISPDRSEKCIHIADGRKIPIDCVYLAIHGENCEDGNIQGFLELAGIAYVGCGTLSSGLCMDKILAKTVLQADGIPVAKWIVVSDTNNVEKKVNAEFTYPVFVKPSNIGSSYGASKVNNESMLKSAVENALKYDNEVLVEEYIDAREIECAVLGNSSPKASILGEIIANDEFYDYDAKYVNGTSTMDIPANLSVKQREYINDIVIKAYKSLRCSGFARVDVFVDRTDSGKIIINEINTLPGFTDISMYPVLWARSGLAQQELLDKIIELGLNTKR